MVIQWDINGIYPLVNVYIAIEHGPIARWFTKNWWFSNVEKNTGPIYNNCLPTLKEDVDGFLEVSTDW